MYKKIIFGGVICLLAGMVFGAPAADKAAAPKTDEAKKPESEQVVMSNLPDKIKLIIGIGETKNYYIRIRAIHSLGKYLPPDQVEALYK